MSGNTFPLFSRIPQIRWTSPLKNAATGDYLGASPFVQQCFDAGADGSFLQRLRFKPLGTNVATVARVYINNGLENITLAVTPATPSGTPSASGGTILSGTYFAKVVAVYADNEFSSVSLESSGVVVTGPTGSIAWTWTATAGAVKYRIYLGNVTNGECSYFETVTNSYSQTGMHTTGADGEPSWLNSTLYGEVSLPATTASATAALPDVEYPMNIALPAGYEIYVGLATAVAAGWQVTGIGGDY